MGYVGLPLAVAFGDAGIKVLGFDLDPAKAKKLNAGQSYIKHITSERVAALRKQKLIEATADMKRLGEPDALLICVPTPRRSDRHVPDRLGAAHSDPSERHLALSRCRRSSRCLYGPGPRHR